MHECNVEIHIPISPTTTFFTMVHFFAASLRRNGGLFCNGRIIVSIGADCEPFDVNQAHPELARYGIIWRWTDRVAFLELDYFATGLRRWSEPFDADYIFMADADLLVCGDISDCLETLRNTRSICGVIATFPPFMARGGGNVDAERWPELFARAGLPFSPMDCPHPGFGHFYDASAGIAMAPPYYNFGFVLGTRQAMTAIAATFEADYRIARDYMNTDLAAQAGLALSIVRNDVTYSTLPTKYNMWSWSAYARAFREDFEDTRILHYLHSEFINKAYDLTSPVRVGAWFERRQEVHDTSGMASFIGSQFLAGLVDIKNDCRNAPLMPVARPLLPKSETAAGYFREIDEARIYSNFGPLCRRLEGRLASRLGLPPESCVAGANATLILSAALLVVAKARVGAYLMPSWTFSASAHAALLAGHPPYFLDVDEKSWQIKPGTVEALLDKGVPIAAVMVVAPFGTPVDVAEWDAFTDRTGVPVVIDAAASFAAQTAGRTPVVVSLHATKLLGIGEGGFMCSTDSRLVDEVRWRLNFGFPGRRTAASPALNGKLSEYGAAIGLAALDEWPQSEQRWRETWAVYGERLQTIPGISLFGSSNISTTMIVCMDQRDHAIQALSVTNIDSRLWWNEGCHREPAFAGFGRDSLAVTEILAARYLGLPIWRDMTHGDIERVCQALSGRITK